MMILLVRCLLLLLVDHVVHSHDLRLALRVLALVILGSSRGLLALLHALLLLLGSCLRSECLRLLCGDGGADVERGLHHHGGVGIVVGDTFSCLIVPAICAGLLLTMVLCFFNRRVI